MEELLTKQITAENAAEAEKELKNVLKDLYAQMKDLSPEDKKARGAEINAFRQSVEEKIAAVKAAQTNAVNQKQIDLTLSKPEIKRGLKHPFYRVLSKFEEYFVTNGFSVITGPEIELDKYNSEMLNIPKHHPARGMQDTFFIEYPEVLLRSHTSAMQIRHMLANKPPVKVISPGLVYRVDDIDPQHTPMFAQLEGLVVGKDVSLADLKGVIIGSIQHVFGQDVKLRFVPGYYPYTEPSAAFDMSCAVCKGKGCRTCKGVGWIRIGGSGMVHPNVFKGVGYPKGTQGFAFGFGIARVPQIYYGFPELRVLHDNNIKIFRGVK